MVVLYLRAVYLFLTALAIIDTVYTMCGFSQMVASMPSLVIFTAPPDDK